MTDGRQSLERLEDLAVRIRRLESELTELRRRAAEIRLAAAGDFRALLCRVGPDLFGLVQAQLREVVLIPKLTPLPEAPPWVLGTFNLRGEILPVVDLQSKFRGESRRPEIDDHVVVAEIDGRLAGFVVTSVSAAVEGHARDVEAAPQNVPYAPYVIGILTVEGAPVPLLDPASLFRVALPDGEKN